MAVFISYAREDIKVASEVATKLREECIVPWIDDYILGGDEWKNVIDQELKNCYAVVVIVTKNSMKSHYVTYEWSFASAMGKRIIPMIYQEPDANSDWKIHPKLSDRNFVNKRDWKKLCKAVRKAEKEISIPVEISDALNTLKSIRLNDSWHDAIFVLENAPKAMAVEQLAKAIQIEIPEVKVLAALALSKLTNFKDVKAIPGLKVALDVPELRKNYHSDALKALASINTDEAIEILLGKFRSEHEEEVLEALSETGHPLTLEFFRDKFDKSLQDAKDRDNNMLHIDTHSIQGLGNLKDKMYSDKIFEVLKYFFDNPYHFVPEMKQIIEKISLAYAKTEGDDSIDKFLEYFREFADPNKPAKNRSTNYDETAQELCLEAIASIQSDESYKSLQKLHEEHHHTMVGYKIEKTLNKYYKNNNHCVSTKTARHGKNCATMNGMNIVTCSTV